MNASAVLGLTVMIVSQAATLARIEPFWTWNTPIAWTGFILFADGIVWQARRNSWLRSAPREFAALALASIPLWLVFEFYNLFIENWYYTGLPENPLLRTLGYAWSFATIWPAIFEGSDLVAVWRRGQEAPAAMRARGHGEPRASIGVSSRWGWGPSASEEKADSSSPRHGRRRWPALSALSMAAGAAMLIWPLVWPSPYLAAPVWLGFIFLLDPVNARLGGASLVRDLQEGRYDRLKNLALSGFLCGGLWEFWNYWSRGKWHYTVPIMEHLKVFEMPLPGYFGFPAFALECFTMYVFVRLIYASAARRFGRIGDRPDDVGRTIAL